MSFRIQNEMAEMAKMAAEHDEKIRILAEGVAKAMMAIDETRSDVDELTRLLRSMTRESTPKKERAA